MDSTKIIEALVAGARPEHNLITVAADDRVFIEEVYGTRITWVGTSAAIQSGDVIETVWEMPRVVGEVPWNDDEADAAELILQSLDDTVYAVRRHAGPESLGRLRVAVWDQFALAVGDGTLTFTYGVAAY